MRMRWTKVLAPCAFLIGCADTQPTLQGSAIAVSVDDRGLPRMLQARDMPPAPAATAMESARTHVERLAGMWGVAPGTLPELRPIGEVKVPGGTIARIAQEIDGLRVWGRELRVLVQPGGALATASGTLIGTMTPRAPAQFMHDENGAVARAVERTYGSHAGAVVEEAMAERVWYPLDGQLVAAWVVDAYTSRATSTHGDANRTIIAGADGRVLEHYSLVADAEFSYTVFAEPTGEKRPLDGPIVDSTPHPTGVVNSGFYPDYIPPSVVSVESLNGPNDPWLAPDATETSGNNVDAYADFNPPSGLNGDDFRASVTAPNTFGHVYDTSASPMASQTQQMAAITSLFYVINWLHDYWYDAGFTEAAGNGQLSNFGRGGEEGDPIRAEAQDNALGGSRNNANMSTPRDGLSPRMQVFLWSGKEERSLTFGPSNTSLTVGTASFSPSSFDVTGQLILGDDGAGVSNTDGCEPLTNAVSGKIVVVDRGNCNFIVKAQNIQAAGGTAMILVDNAPGTSPPGMGGEGTVSIGVLSVTLADGNLIKQEIANGCTCTATLHRKQGHELDGSLDATLIAHEFGHYLHHRLSDCNNTMCGAMSEGWGDFLALMLLARDGDDLDGAYPFSVYTTQSFSSDPAYFGIRRAPYSVNTDINSLSFRHMRDGEPLPNHHPFNGGGTNYEVHNAGEVWASALWEAYVALQKAGASSSSFAEIRDKMAKYVVSGLLMSPPDASPLEVRDAILAAALAAGNSADHDTMMAAFARRGFGSCAVAPPPTSQRFVEIVESTIVAGSAKLETLALTDNCDNDGVLDTGETAKLKIQIANKGHAALTNVKLEVTSTTAGVKIVSQPATVATLERLGTTDAEFEIKLEDGPTAPVPGDLTLKITADGACEQEVTVPIGTRFNVDDVPEKAALDNFDTAESVWDASTTAWSHVRPTPLDGEWHGANQGRVGDVQLTSPLLTASATEPLVITFQHKYSFEMSQNTFWDGGVIEYSIDDGETWVDISELADPGYDGELTGQADNPLGGRMAYSGDSEAWPNFNTVSLDLGTALAGKQFRIRFRIGTDQAVDAPGWTIDEISFSGIEGTPFPLQLPDDGSCIPMDPEDPNDPADPEDGDGGGCCDAGPLRGSSFALAFAVLGLVVRRRRRS